MLLAPYTDADVREAFSNSLQNRKPLIPSKFEAKKNNFIDNILRDESESHRSATVIKTKENINLKAKRVEDDNMDADKSMDIWAVLEEACAQLGYTLETIEGFLAAGQYPPELLNLVAQQTGCNDTSQLIESLNTQRNTVLQRVRDAIRQLKKSKSDAEKKACEKAKRIGKCPANFDWIKCPGGYRCAGGSHFVSASQVNSIED